MWRARFWAKVTVDDPHSCWLWNSCKCKSGYGLFRRKTRGCKTLAHRIAWQLMRGTIPSGINVLHKCDNPGCVNPSHLFLGTQADNVADMMAKGRCANGERARWAKLSRAQVIDLKRMHESGTKQCELVSIFSISPAQVSRIVNGSRWRHLTG